MAINFHRDCTLIFGKPSREKNFLIPRSIVSPRLIEQGTTPSGTPLPTGDYLDFNTIPGLNYHIKDCQIKASIGQAKVNSNPCQIELINGPRDVVNSLRKDDSVILKAGYINRDQDTLSSPNSNSSLPNLFVGQIVQVYTVRQREDYVTKIIAAEAITVTKNVHLVKSYTPSTTREAVIRDLVALAKDNGIPTGKIYFGSAESESYKISQKPYLTGLTVKGMLIENLEILAESVGLDCYTALGKIYIEPKVESKENKQLFVITPDQIIGDIGMLSDNTSTASNDNNTSDSVGLRISVFLEGSISIDKFIRIKDAPGFNGDYSITSVSHNLDYRATDWKTTVTLETL